MAINKKLGQLIRAKRKQKGFSQDRFALAAQIDRSYMGRVERGEVNMTIEFAIKISNVLECSLSSLLIEIGE